MKSLVLAPHNDDETLWTSFVIQRERPVVAVVFDSIIQVTRGAKNCDARTRRRETMTAMRILTGEEFPDVRFLGFPDDEPPVNAMIRAAFQSLGDPEVVYAPAIEEGGHTQHNLVGFLAQQVFGDRVKRYLTYTRAGKSTGIPVPFEPSWVARKLRALACYESQIAHPDNTEHFLRDQREWMQA